MDPRTVSQVLHEWRTAERELDEATDAEIREAIEARIARLHSEYREALDGHSADAAALAAPPSIEAGDRPQT